jgi:hypothetical protein
MSDDDESGSSAVVDFDALNAALGALPPVPTSSPTVASDSEGRSSATYASARPHAPPSTRGPLVDPNTPAVIVAEDDTMETPPVPVTSPFAPRPALLATVPMVGAPSHPSHPPQMPTGPPSFPPMAMPSASPVPPQAISEPVTLPVVRGIPRPRKPPSTVVVPRGPTNVQKLLVFLAMLVVVVAGGVSAVLYYEPAAFSFLHGSRSAGGTTVLQGSPSASAPRKGQSH